VRGISLFTIIRINYHSFLYDYIITPDGDLLGLKLEAFIIVCIIKNSCVGCINLIFMFCQWNTAGCLLIRLLKYRLRTIGTDNAQYRLL
jgi:hypothetical protein